MRGRCLLLFDFIGPAVDDVTTPGRLIPTLRERRSWAKAGTSSAAERFSALIFDPETGLEEVGPAWYREVFSHPMARSSMQSAESSCRYLTGYTERLSGTA